MPPKKKATKTKQQGTEKLQKTQQANAAEKPKQEKVSVPAQTANKEPSKASNPKTQQPAKKPQTNLKVSDGQNKQGQKQASKAKILNIEQQQNLSEAQLLRRRKLRFGGIVGTQLTAEEAQKVKAARQQKFGGEPQLTKQDIAKRRQKFFSNPNKIVNDDDPQTVNKRKQKFGGLGDESEDKAKVEERRKKFGINETSLDDLIEKDRERNKERHNNKRGRSFNSYGNHGKPNKKFNR